MKMKTPVPHFGKHGELLYGGMTTEWALVFGTPPGKKVTVTPADMKSCTVGEGKPGVWNCLWRGAAPGGEDFEVAVTWRKGGPGLCGTIGFRGNSSGMFVEEILFPVSSFPVDGNSKFLAPFGPGEEYRVLEPGKALPQGAFRSFQFAACYDGPENYYFDHRDPGHHTKDFVCTLDRERKNLTYTVRNPLPLEESRRDSSGLGFESGIGICPGRWFEAAMMYREWACRQPWYLNRNRKNPMRETAMWVWNRGLIGDVIPPVERLSRDLGLPVALDWYWWHEIPYDTEYPEFWPPREGEQAFRNAVRRLSEQKIYVQVYLNGMSWDMDGRTWPEGGQESAVICRDGSVLSLWTNAFNGHRAAHMCGEGLRFREKIVSLAEKLYRCGLPGVYLDMIGCGHYYDCYNTQHRHAPGGGDYQVRGYRELLREIHARCPGFSLSTESSLESCMDLFDSVIILAPSYERTGSGSGSAPVPAFQAVYHGAVAAFGNFDHFDGTVPFDSGWPRELRWKQERPWNELYPDQFAAELARTVIWGMQPTVCNLKAEHASESRFAPDYEFLLSTARFYFGHRGYLYDGVMLEPGRLDVCSVPVKFMRRTLFTKEDAFSETTSSLPAVFHSCWQDPGTGRRALILCNYTRVPRQWKWNGLSGTLAPRTWQAEEIP